jgi:hypothetical protein
MKYFLFYTRGASFYGSALIHRAGLAKNPKRKIPMESLTNSRHTKQLKASSKTTLCHRHLIIVTLFQ